MERLYDLLHRVSRATNRQGVLQADLSFLTSTHRMMVDQPADDRSIFGRD